MIENKLVRIVATEGECTSKNIRFTTFNGGNSIDAQEFHVVPHGHSFDDSAFKLLAKQFDNFSDEEVLSGQSAQVFLTDGTRDICYFVSSDGYLYQQETYRKHMDKHLSDVECLVGYLLNNKVISSERECLSGGWICAD